MKTLSTPQPCLQQVLRVALSYRAAELSPAASVSHHLPQLLFIHVAGEFLGQLLQLLQGLWLALGDVRRDERPEVEIQTR